EAADRAEKKFRIDNEVPKDAEVANATNPLPGNDPAPMIAVDKEVKVVDVPVEGGVPVVAAKEKPKDKDKTPPKESSTKDPKTEFKEPAEIGGKNFAFWRGELKKADPGRHEEAIKAMV